MKVFLIWIALVAGATFQPESARPLVQMKPSKPSPEQRKVNYSDNDFTFATINYGPKGKGKPGLHVYSKKQDTWQQILKISTNQAVLGRSPTFEEVQKVGKKLPSVAWDFSKYRKEDYAPMPLFTSGSISFPDQIVFDSASKSYILSLHTAWKIQAVTTQFIVKKADLDKGFAGTMEAK